MGMVASVLDCLNMYCYINPMCESGIDRCSILLSCKATLLADMPRFRTMRQPTMIHAALLGSYCLHSVCHPHVNICLMLGLLIGGNYIDGEPDKMILLVPLIYQMPISSSSSSS